MEICEYTDLCKQKAIEIRELVADDASDTIEL